jgi:hypothetical protein
MTGVSRSRCFAELVHRYKKEHNSRAYYQRYHD